MKKVAETSSSSQRQSNSFAHSEHRQSSFQTGPLQDAPIPTSIRTTPSASVYQNENSVVLSENINLNITREPIGSTTSMNAITVLELNC